jgi:uncharacterized protein YdaL
VSNVIWSDETKICRFSSSSGGMAWTKEEAKPEVQDIVQTVRYCGGSIMIRNYIMTYGPRPLRIVSGHLDQHQYLHMFNEYLPDVINKYGMDKEIIYQYDNDSKHRARSV